MHILLPKEWLSKYKAIVLDKIYYNLYHNINYNELWCEFNEPVNLKFWIMTIIVIIKITDFLPKGCK